MRLQILSDLHLEFYGLTKMLRLLRWIPVRGNVLVLAGDIGDPYKLEFRAFFEWTSAKFEHVVYVPGNHEYYFHSIPEVHARIHSVLSAYTNVYVLNGSSVEVDGVRFVGTTLWTKIVDPHKLVADAERIHGFSVESNNELHDSHRQFLTRELAEPTTNPTVVVTHHLPSWNCLRIHSPYNQCFASESDDLVQNCTLWIHGHSHIPSDETVRGIRIVSNPIGHPGELMSPAFDFCIDIDT